MDSQSNPLERIVGRHTPGPWHWEVTPSGEVRLATPDRGKLYVMGFARRGMQGAQPRFSLWGEGERDRRGGIMHDFHEAGGADHPDARLIAAAPELLAMLQECAHDLEAEIAARADGELPRRIDRDMDTVRRAKSVIAKALGVPPNGAVSGRDAEANQ